MIDQFFTAYNLKLWSFESKDENNWVFQPDHVTLAFTVAKRWYCKNLLFSARFQNRWSKLTNIMY